MQLQIKTTVLQDMVGKAIKCSSNNKLIPITSLMNIKVANNTFYLTTTDATNYFYVKSGEKVECEDFEISVIADNFTKLIQKTTSENVILDYSDKRLKVKGNGEYNIELPLDENGGPIKFPEMASIELAIGCGTISQEAIKSALDYNKSSLSTSLSYPALTCYYCGDSIITSNQIKICANKVKSFDEPTLVSGQLMELLGVMSNNIEITKTEEKMIFRTDLECIVSNISAKIDEFPLAPIQGLLDSNLESSCVIPKDVVLNVLDRLSLFMSNYDNKGIDIVVTKDGVMFKTTSSNGVEVVPYTDSQNFVDYVCRINIEVLKEQLSTHAKNEIKFYYGNPKIIKLESDNITQIIALMEGGN